MFSLKSRTSNLVDLLLFLTLTGLNSISGTEAFLVRRLSFFVGRFGDLNRKTPLISVSGESLYGIKDFLNSSILGE